MFVFHSSRLIPTVLAAEESKGLAVPGRVLDDVVKVQAAADDSLCNGALVLCNPGASSVPEADPQTPQPEVHLHAAAPPDSESGSADLQINVESLSKDITETSKDKNSVGHLGKSLASWSVPFDILQPHIEKDQRE